MMNILQEQFSVVVFVFLFFFVVVVFFVVVFLFILLANTAEANTGPAMLCIWLVFYIHVWCIF